MSTQAIALPAVDALTQTAMTLPDQARDIIVIDQASYELAAGKLLDVAALRREITEYHKPLKSAANETHRRICSAEKTMLAPVELAEEILKRGIGAYQMEQRRIQEQREREARAAADLAAAEALEESIEAAEAEGASVEEVQAIIAQPLPVAVTRIAPAMQQVAGVSSAKTYKVEVFNLKELCRAIAAGEVPAVYVTANLVALNGLARSTRGAVKIPGVRVVEDVTVRAGRR